MINKKMYFGAVWNKLLIGAVLVGLLLQPLAVAGFAQDGEPDSPATLGESHSTSQPERDTDEADSSDTRDEDLPAPTDDKETKAYIEEIEIASPEALYALAQHVNSGNALNNVLITLTADIVLDPAVPWVPIGNTLETPFSGHFDGRDFRIVNCTVEDGVKGGLFGYLEGAVIQDVVLKNVQAPDSVSGLYHVAIRSTITGCAKKWGLFGLFSSGISHRSGLDYWNGTPDTSFIPPAAGEIVIDTGGQLAQIAQLSVLGNSFSGQTLILTTDIDLQGHLWTPIPTFGGDFYGGKNTIYNMTVREYNSGFFSSIYGGSVNNLCFDNADVDISGESGILTNRSYSTITGIIVKNSRIKADQAAAGIVAHQTQMHSGAMAPTDSLPISQCVVLNTEIIADSLAAGIVVLNENVAVTQCAVYGSTFKAAITAGIAYKSTGPNYNYSAVNQHVVLGNHHVAQPGQYYPDVSNDGIVSTADFWNSSSNCFISDISFESSSASNSTRDYLGTGSLPYGLDSYFTDSRLDSPLVNNTYENSWTGTTEAPMHFIRNCYWDKSTVDGVREGTSTLPPEHGHAFYDTNYLTNGAWVPNDTYWEAKKDSYPYLKYPMMSDTPFLREITGLAAVAVLLDNPEETLSSAKQLRLVERTAAGDAITWTATDSTTGTTLPIGGAGSPMQTRSASGSKILFTTENDGVLDFDLHAAIMVDGEPLEKNFSNLSLLDSYLDEDESARFPAVGTMLDLGEVPRLVFNDPLEANTAAIGSIRLLAKRADGTFTTEAVLPCDSSSLVITPMGSQYKVEVQGFSYVPGYEYQLVLPKGALEEIHLGSGQRKGNFSDEITFVFSTNKVDDPYILLNKNLIQLMSNSPLTVADIKEWFSVYESVAMTSGSMLHGPGLDTATALSGPVTDPQVTLDSLSAGVYYYIDPAMLTVPRPAGTSVMHVFAVNAAGLRARRTISLQVSALPTWETEPKEIVHAYWTEDKAVIEAAALSGATASYDTVYGNKQSALLKAVITPADWATAQAVKEGPTKVMVTTYMLDRNGDPVTAEGRQCTVYLDRTLKYTFNTAPLRYAWTEDRTMDKWKELIEEDIDFVALNFAPTANVRYDHGANDYSENKVYKVHLTTAPQVVTLCDGSAPCAAENHSHLKDQVKLTFTVKITDSKDPQERLFWKKVGDDILQSEFNDAVQRRPRLSYTDHLDGEDYSDNYFEMPAEITEMLRLQPYNRLDLHYSAYQWKFYGHALTGKPEKQSLYPLKVSLREDQTLVRRVIGKNAPAVQVAFDYVGLLNGRVEFFYDLRLAGGLSREEIESTDFYLYKYVRTTRKLVPVSDVIVDADGWASVVLTSVDDEIYVFTDAKFGGTQYERYIGYNAMLDSETEPDDFLRFRSRQDVRSLDLELFETDAVEGLYSYPFSRETKATIKAVDQALALSETVGSSQNYIIPTVIAASCVLLAGAAVVVYRCKKGKGPKPL